MTQKFPQIEHKEIKKVVILLGFQYINTVGNHEQYKNKETGKKTTLPFYKKPYHSRLIKDIAWQIGITKKELIKFATDKKEFKKLRINLK